MRSRYNVKVGKKSSVIVTASSAYDAKMKAWDDIKPGYTYGWKNKTEFMRKAKVERLG